MKISFDSVLLLNFWRVSVSSRVALSEFWKGTSGPEKQVSETKARSRGQAVREAAGCVLALRSALPPGLLHGAGARPPGARGGLSLSVWATEKGAFPAPPTGRWTLRTDWWGRRCREAGEELGAGPGSGSTLDLLHTATGTGSLEAQSGEWEVCAADTVSSNSDVRHWCLVEWEERVRPPGPALPFPAVWLVRPAASVTLGPYSF